MRLISFLSIILFSSALFGQRVSILGYAPTYTGKTVKAYDIEDYFSGKERLIATSTVQADSLFSLTFDISEVRKIVIRSGNNHGFILVEPNASYRIYFPERDKYTPYRPTGNEVELAFLDLDSTDINYKVLSFQRWVDHFLGNNYHLHSVDAKEFMTNLDKFKANVEKAYKEDTSIYLKAHVRFTLAGLDNIPNAAERNRFEKYDFYLRNTPVYYNCETYMTYVSDFYQKLLPRLSNEANQAVYDGILRSSPTLIMHALGTEYTLSNIQLRELVMIKTLSEAFHDDEFPQTNILTVLDSLSQRAIFKQHRVIAANIRNKLTELVPGGKAPDFVLLQEGSETKTLYNFAGKHVYLHFMDPESLNSRKELPLLKELHQNYAPYIHFVTVYKEQDLSEEGLKAIRSLDWDVYGLSESNAIWDRYRIESYPQYTLIDAAGYVVASPSLGPTPNGEYKTIDETFFHIKKAIDESH